MAKKTQHEIRTISPRLGNSGISLLEVDNSVIGAICRLGEDYYEEKARALQAAGISQEAISKSTTLHKSQHLRLVRHLYRETVITMTSIVDSLQPVFDSVGADPIVRASREIAERLTAISAKQQNKGTVEELTSVLELLIELNCALYAHIKVVKANRSKAVANLLARKPRAAPFTQEVIAAVYITDDLSFLNEKSWPRRVAALRRRESVRFAALSDERQQYCLNGGQLQAGDRHIINILKEIPRVRRHLQNTTQEAASPARDNQ